MSETSFQDLLLGEAPAPKALTIHQPFASLIVAGIKDVENRSKPTQYRGTLIIHAGLTAEAGPMAEHGHLVPAYPAGAIIGTVELVGCTWGYASPWTIEGQWQWILANPRACEPVPAKGALSLWKPQPGDWDRAQASLA